jgi:hypothetical protein
MHFEFLFKPLAGVGPVDRFGGVIVRGDVVSECSF